MSGKKQIWSQVKDRVGRFQTDGYPLDEVLILKKLEENGASGPHVCVFIMDVEMDVFEVSFCPEGLITINPGELKYVMIDPDTLGRISEFQYEANASWEAIQEYWNGDDWVGWEHLIYKHETMIEA